MFLNAPWKSFYVNLPFKRLFVTFWKLIHSHAVTPRWLDDAKEFIQSGWSKQHDSCSWHTKSRAPMLVTSKAVFTITADIHACSLANFYCQYADRHLNLKFMRWVSEWERAIQQFVIVKTNWCQFLMHLCCYWSWASSSHCKSSCGSTKTDVNLLNFSKIIWRLALGF